MNMTKHQKLTQLNIAGLPQTYTAHYRAATTAAGVDSAMTRETYWRKQAEALHWFKAPQQILTRDEAGLYRWFADGVLNTAYLALDQHVAAGRGEQPALLYDSPVTTTRRCYSYAELLTQVAKFAGALAAHGLKKGDRVVMYMPMIPEAVITMLACARLGAVHSVVFGGFAPQELAARIRHARPKFIVTASCGIEITRIIDYMAMVRTALDLSGHSVEHVVVAQRAQAPAKLQAPLEVDFHAWLDAADEVPCVEVRGTDPLYILYTSGTTGSPKGVMRDHGGHAVALKYSMDAIFDTHAGEVFWAASDIGWVVGHSYIVYAPLIQGCTTILYEGKPVKTPDAGEFYRVIAEYNVKTFFTAPTAFRAIKKEDAAGTFAKRYDLSKLRYVFSAGERLDPPTAAWLQEIFTEQTLVDNWWQTETGWPIVANPLGIQRHPLKIGSATFPVPGFAVEILDDEGQRCPVGTAGNIAIKLPLPPGCLPTLWGDTDLFKRVYLSFKEGYYLSGDGGYVDEDGYVFVMGRLDDVINVAGHRFSTGELEEVIGGHVAVAECAVIGLNDDVKGQVPFALMILKDGVTLSAEQVVAEVITKVRNEVGAVAALRQALVVKRLPKTRSGKILRKTLRRLTDEERVAVPSTIDDPAIIAEIIETFKRAKVGRYGRNV